MQMQRDNATAKSDVVRRSGGGRGGGWRRREFHSDSEMSERYWHNKWKLNLRRLQRVNSNQKPPNLNRLLVPVIGVEIYLSREGFSTIEITYDKHPNKRYTWVLRMLKYCNSNKKRWVLGGIKIRKKIPCK